ncbi:hypothetical protein [Sphingomonas aerophila]|uniref:Uncharacterized protein n=1 Tax=Sphingomonas aerophila TaxID=1344948 RepID=A0A7W9BH16_9SPHN|nr:hypothetical protein [Sphingomonas aerophila]MBB5716988.1 hypothetical protein [Sphingomonas aerophila]
MPISILDLVAAVAVLIGIPASLVLIARRSKQAALWFAAGILCFVVGGSAIEKLVTGASGLF